MSELRHEDLGPYRVTDSELDLLRRAHRGATQLLGSGDVVGVGIGPKVRGGKTLAQLSVKVFVRSKLPREAVDPRALVPPEIEGVPTDVEEVGTPQAGAEVAPSPYRQWHRPVPAGVSVGPGPTKQFQKPETGTLGCFVAAADGRRFILSNNHVLAHCNIEAKGTPIIQPGCEDKGTPEHHVVASLTLFKEMGFGSKGGTNKADAAIAEVKAETVIDPRVLRDDRLEPLGEGTVTPSLGLKVQKSGRTTGHTKGEITAVKVDVWVSYADILPTTVNTAQFVEQFRVTGEGDVFFDGGDSGSLVTTVAGNHPVGLAVSGDGKNKKLATCTPIGTVLEVLGSLLQSKLTVLTELKTKT